MKVSLLGACGRIGLPLGYLITEAGHEVTGIDPKYQLGELSQLDRVGFPYVEEGMESTDGPWKQTFRKIKFTDKYDSISDSEVIVVVIGTPVDGENNPRIENIINTFNMEIIPRIQKNTLIILRSTVSPGTTELIQKMILDKRQDLIEGTDYFLVFAPERVSQGHSLEETSRLPQLIGHFSKTSLERASDFFSTMKIDVCISLTPREAEYGKLITNMYRYVNIALANEFYMIASGQDVNTHKVINACNYGYPRMNMALPGPNAAGPCLFKDGKMLTENVPYGDIINVSFNINEGMPAFVFRQLMDKAKETGKQIKNVTILGMSFKSGNDDTRYSASYKLKKILLRNGIGVKEVDPYLVSEITAVIADRDIDGIILMTPHESIIYNLRNNNYYNETIVIDGWNMIAPGLKNGIYTIGEYEEWLES